MHVDAPIAFPPHRAGDVVADSKRAKSFALAFAQRAEGIGCFAALADGEDERIAAHRGVAMAKLAGVFHFHRNIGQLLDQVFAYQRSMQCCPTSR